MNVDCRGQPIGAAILLHLPEDSPADLLHQLCVPGLCQSIGHRESGGVLVDNGVFLRVRHHVLTNDVREGIEDRHGHLHRLHLSLFGHTGAFLNPQTGRAVAQGNIYQSFVPELGGGIAYGTRQVKPPFSPEHSDAHNNLHHILYGQRREHFLNPLIGALLRRFIGITCFRNCLRVQDQSGQAIRDRLPLESLGGKFLPLPDHRADVAMAGDDNFLFNQDHANQHSIPGRVAETQQVFACLKHIGSVLLPIAGKRLHVKRHFQSLPLPGSQAFGLPEGSQGLIFLRQLAIGRGDINLSHFFPRICLAGVDHRCLYRHLAAIQRNSRRVDGESRITQAEAEGERRFHTEGIKIPVADIDSLFVVFILKISIEIAVRIGKRNISIPLGPGIRKLTGRCYLAAEQIRKGVSALGPQLAQVDNGVDSRNLLQEGNIHSRAAVDGQHKMRVLFCAGSDGLFLRLRQEPVSFFHLTVTALTCLATQDINTAIRITVSHICVGNGPATGNPEIVLEHLHDEIGFEKIDPLFHLLQIGLQCGSIVFLKIRNPLVGGYGEAAIFQALQDGDRMTLIDFTGAGAAFDGPGCAGTIQRHFSGL